MKKSVDFIGVGTGPFNLSIAALSHQIEELNCLFFDEHPHFSWHPGMLVPDCHMQTVFLKDLVSAVAPTNPYSFVNYLVKHKKFYRFLTSRLRTVSREEFSDYLRWAAEDMNNLYFSHTVENIDFDKKRTIVSWFRPVGEEYFVPQYLPWYRKTTLFTTLCEACDTILFPCQ